MNTFSSNPVFDSQSSPSELILVAFLSCMYANAELQEITGSKELNPGQPIKTGLTRLPPVSPVKNRFSRG
jgi:hypothetical protein